MSADHDAFGTWKDANYATFVEWVRNATPEQGIRNGFEAAVALRAICGCGDVIVGEGARDNGPSCVNCVAAAKALAIQPTCRTCNNVGCPKCADAGQFPRSGAPIPDEHGAPGPWKMTEAQIDAVDWDIMAQGPHVELPAGRGDQWPGIESAVRLGIVFTRRFDVTQARDMIAEIAHNAIADTLEAHKCDEATYLTSVLANMVTQKVVLALESLQNGIGSSGGVAAAAGAGARRQRSADALPLGEE